jgi:hypothetical protein
MRRQVRLLLPAVLAALAAALCWSSPSTMVAGRAGVRMELPSRIGYLQGYPQKPSAEELRLLPTDTSFAKMTYATSDAAPDERDIVHYSIVLAGAESRSIHRPEICLPGQGWTIEDSRHFDLDLPGGQTLPVRDLIISGSFLDERGQRQHRRAHYVYWFTGDGITTANHAERIWRSVTDAVMHGQNHRWAYSAVMATITEALDPSASGERKRTEEETLRLITYVIQHAAPVYQKVPQLH